MARNATRLFDFRARLGFYVAVDLLTLFSCMPRTDRAQSAKSCDSNPPQRQLQRTTTLPAATATRVTMNAAPATGYLQTINLPGASDQPLVHSSFDSRSSMQQPVYRGGETNHAAGALVMQPSPVYYTGSDRDQHEHSVLGQTTAAPIPSAPAGKYTGSLRIMLTGDSAATTIYFTLDGTEPTTDSFLYVHPFTLTSSATLKAFAISPGKSPSSITTVTYKVIQPTLGFEIGSNGIDKVDFFLTLNAPGAASVAGEWTLRDGTLTLCTANLTTETSLHCDAKLNRGSHDLKATYNGTNNGWKLTAGSTLRVN